MLRGRVQAGHEAPLVERLRSLGRDDQGPMSGFVSATFGFRRDGHDLHFMALSTWESIEAISRATGGPPNVPLPSQPPGRELAAMTIDLFEVADESLTHPAPEAAALGLIWGRIAPHAESTAHGMIRATARSVTEAGVLSLTVGRRAIDAQSEILVVAAWRDRLSLHSFAKRRAGKVIDPAFLELLTEWRFETYDCLFPGVIEVAPAAPAVLLADDSSRYVDASPAIEGLLGLPAELILGRSLDEVTPPDQREAGRLAWSAFVATGRAEGTFELLRPDGTIVPVSFRALANCPLPGIHASVLTSLGEAPDPRPVADIVAALFPLVAVAA